VANQVVYSKIFIRKAKELKKRHLSLVSDLEDLEKSLLEEPRQGND
jgi:mRNA-degrading endonuclease RelE of RelBE toxin-antitoxin system